MWLPAAGEGVASGLFLDGGDTAAHGALLSKTVKGGAGDSRPPQWGCSRAGMTRAAEGLVIGRGAEEAVVSQSVEAPILIMLANPRSEVMKKMHGSKVTTIIITRSPQHRRRGYLPPAPTPSSTWRLRP